MAGLLGGEMGLVRYESGFAVIGLSFWCSWL